MMVFWLVAVLLIAAALLFLIPPLLQGGAKKKQLARDQINILLYKDQLAELDADLKNGAITQSQFDQAHSDLERGLLEDIKNEDTGAGSESKVSGAPGGNKTAIVVSLLVPVMAFALYNHLGGGAQALHPENVQTSMQVEGHQGTLEEQVRKLQDHLQANPDDVEGRVMLARSYYFLKQYRAASDAFARAVTLTGEQDANLLADYADALAMANGRNMAGQPYEIVKKALQVEPTHQKSLWLAATATYQAQDYKTTLQYWEKLIQQFPPGSENYVQMQRNIAEVQQLLGMPVDPQVAASLTSEASASEQPAKSGAASVSGIVQLDPSLQSKVSPTDTLFVFARAVSGPRMPLAIVRKQVSDLPLTFTLDDSSAMNPAMRISNFPQVVVGARISKSGNAMPQSGDLSGSTDPVAVGSSGLQITINNAVP